MADSVAQLGLLVDLRDADAEAVAQAATELREELLQLDIESADAPSIGQAPPGTRAAEIVALGSLIVSLIQSPGLLSSVVGTVQSWVARQGSRSVKLELDGDVLEVTGISSREQSELIQNWIDRHRDG